MSVVGSSLSGEQERKLLSLFNNVRLHLLYKASVHGYMHQAFHNRCDGQGPTILVAYNKTGFIFGGYITTVQQLPGNSYIFEPEEMHGNDLQLTECEVYRVEQRGDILEKPWRNINWEGFSTKQRLMDYIQNYKPEVNSVVQARVLLVGPVGAGKSSFFNSINSVFKGHVTGPANSGSAGTSLTTQFRTYNIKAGQDRSALPLVLCDTMGLEEGLGAGLDIDDITSVLKGHIQDRYQFNPSTSIQSDSSFFCKSPSLKDRIHCVVYVLDACKISLISAKMVDKFTAIRKIVNKQGVPLLVLLTKVDEACPLVKEDLTNIYISHYIEKMIREVSLCIGVSQSCVVPVKNYSREFELDVNTDILLLSAVVQMLRYTDDYFDDLYQAGDQRPETPDS
ncbi:interferon-induced protein 44-like isoform X2 [Esox lucius]|uniref:interferon-induced protein 44-like isoform X2 n=1 Tax=Esox lucius TaxID=8010 RepID=UPI000973492E|nr:interferon-induced protein 44-like isoform X2 [Esox lucius]